MLPQMVRLDYQCYLGRILNRRLRDDPLVVAGVVLAVPDEILLDQGGSLAVGRDEVVLTEDLKVPGKVARDGRLVEVPVARPGIGLIGADVKLAEDPSSGCKVAFG